MKRRAVGTFGFRFLPVWSRRRHVLVVAAACACAPGFARAQGLARAPGFDRAPGEIVNYFNGLRVDVRGASTADYQDLILWPDNSSPSQEFSSRSSSSLVAAHSSKCLEVDPRAQAPWTNGTRVVQLPCTPGPGDPWQQWDWVLTYVSIFPWCSGPLAHPCIEPGLKAWLLKNRATSKCLDATNPTASPPPLGARLQLWDCLTQNSGIDWNTPNQAWASGSISHPTVRPPPPPLPPIHIAAVRVGDGGAQLSSASAPVFIDFLPLRADQSASSVALPTAGSSSLTMSGTAVTEGALRLSPNGRYATLAGYAAPPGVANVAATSAAVSRVVGLLDGCGDRMVDTRTRLSNAFSGGNVRGAVTDDGSHFWITGSGAAGTGGVQFADFGASTSVALTPNLSGARVPGIFADQLMVSSASGSFFGISIVGAGVPRSAQPVSLLLSAPSQSGVDGPAAPSRLSPNDFVALDFDSNVPGSDRIYVADDHAPSAGGGIHRWVNDGTRWTLTAIFAPSGPDVGIRGLAGQIFVDGLVHLFATTTETTENRILAFVDDGLNQGFDVVAVAPPNTAFRGLDFAPVCPPAPGPESTAAPLALPASSPSLARWLAVLLAVLGTISAATRSRRARSWGA
jgi:hypothetical protein